MARASRVHGIHPARSLRENAAKIVEVRLGELLSWRSALHDPELVAELHNMRIAAKRLRYAIETFQVCFPDIKAVAKDLSDIQEDLGDIHDLDVLTDVLRARLRALDEPMEGRAVDIMAMDLPQVQKSARLRQLVSSEARDQRRLGLLGLLGDKVNERRARFDMFRGRWDAQRLAHLEGMVMRAIGPAPSADGVIEHASLAPSANGH